MYSSVNLVMLVSAALAAMALGVILGHVCCMGLFAIMRAHSHLAKTETVETAVASTLIS